MTSPVPIRAIRERDAAASSINETSIPSHICKAASFRTAVSNVGNEERVTFPIKCVNVSFSSTFIFSNGISINRCIVSRSSSKLGILAFNFRRSSSNPVGTVTFCSADKDGTSNCGTEISMSTRDVTLFRPAMAEAIRVLAVVMSDWIRRRMASRAVVIPSVICEGSAVFGG